jgi:hypothetical protein
VTIIHCEVALESEALATRAAEWAPAFYPDLEISLEAGRVTVASDSRSEGELRLIWRSALANEKLLLRGAAQRAAVLAALVR